MHKLGEDNPQYQPVHTYVMNPKAVSMGELYGEVNKLTLEWQDGLMATIIRVTVNVSIKGEEKLHFVVFTGFITNRKILQI